MTPDPRGAHAQSLAGRLTRALILWLGGVWLLCVLGVVWYIDREINYNFDNELDEVSHRIFDIALQHLDRARAAADAADGPLILPTPGLFADSEVLWQLVAPNSRVLARSANARRRAVRRAAGARALPTPLPGACTPWRTRHAPSTCRWPTRSTSAARPPTAPWPA